MNGDTIGICTTRAATREGKDCTFKREMIARVSRQYNLDAPFRIGTGAMIVAGLSPNVTHTPDWYDWERFKIMNRE